MVHAYSLVYFVVHALLIGLAGCEGDGPDIDWPDSGPNGDADSDSDLPDGDSTVGCVSDDQCDDGIDCTTDRCNSSGLCDYTATHELCHDELQCNGVEFCDSTLGCQAGIPYPGCNDHDACTIDDCIEPEVPGALPQCDHSPMDRDRDGYVDNHCLVIPGNPDGGWGDDCDDLDPFRHPDAGEFCFDGEDNDCDLLVDGDDEDCILSNDTCDAPIELLDGVIREGFTFGALGDYDLSCGWGSDPDVVYVFEVPEESDVTIEVWGNDIYPSLAIQSACGDLSSERACISGGSNVRFFERALSAGTYYVIVKSWMMEGSFRLLFDVSEPTEPPIGDSCTDPLELEAGVTNTVDIGEYGADSTLSCMAAEDYHDVVYFFNVPTDSDIRYEVEASGFTPYVAVSWDCDDVGGELVCDGENNQRRTLCGVPAGTYFLTVRGSRPGDLDVTVSLDSPSDPPPNDSCPGAMDVSAGGTFAGTLLCTDLDHPRPSCDFRSAHDAVFTFTLDEPQNVLLELTAEDGLIPVLSLQSTCGSPSTELFCERNSSVNRLFNNLAAGTYFIVVTGEFQADFQLNVTYSSPTSACSGALVITESQVLTESNMGAGDTFRTTCGNRGMGADVPFQIEVPYTFDLRAEILAAFSNTILHLRETCDDPSSEIACNDDIDVTTYLSRIEQTDLPGGTYTLVVDSYGLWAEGAFTIEIDIEPGGSSP